MKNVILLFSLLVVVTLTSCEKEEYSVFQSDNRPEVPVTFPGTITYGFNPYIEHSISGGGNIQFTLSIPEESGRTIKEITRVAAGATGINAGTVKTGTYISSPIPVNGTTATFTTTLEEFATKTGEAAKTESNKLVKAGKEIAFMFLVTLEDDGNTNTADTIIPVQVRVRLKE